MRVKTTTLAMSLITILMLSGCGEENDVTTPLTTQTETSNAQNDTATPAETQTANTTQEDTAVAEITDAVEPQASESFGYETQRDVKVSISITNTKEDTPQKQILI